ncbi:MAG: hypothetical protein Kow0069_21920 [Promethearchaeota archaeon]
MELDVSERIYKCVVAGEGGVGKTTLIRRLIEGRFVEGIKMTIGTALATHSLDVTSPDPKIGTQHMKFSIWDFAGEKRFRFFLPQYAKGAMGVILVYDLTRYATFEHLDEWFEILSENTPDGAVFVLVGAKKDMEKNRAVSTEQAEAWQRAHDVFAFVETSSKTGENNRKIFETLALEILRRTP